MMILVRCITLLFGLLLFTPLALAVPPPTVPPAHAPYVRSLLNAIKQDLSGKASSGPSTTTGMTPEESRAKMAAELRLLFTSFPAGVSENQQDGDRSACFVSDLRAVETVLAELINLALVSAGNLDLVAAEHYRDSALYLWGKLGEIRRSGLDPTMQAPVFAGTGTGSPPPGSDEKSDDALCPYDSLYAPSGIGGVGCTTLGFPFTGTGVLIAETTLLQKILLNIATKGTGLTEEFTLYRQKVFSLRQKADAFMRGLHVGGLGVPAPLTITLPLFDVFLAPNAGESGCYGWPSDVDPSTNVTGEGMPRLDGFPEVTTRSLYEALAFLADRNQPEHEEYVREFERRIKNQGGNLIGTSFEQGSLEAINRAHVLQESQLLLSVREPQMRMARLADMLHASTRTFTGQAVLLAGSPVGMPPLRDFVARFTAFLLGMCTNRGCGDALLRAYELSLRDECFPLFQSALFFLKNPGASTLPPCSAKFAK